MRCDNRRRTSHGSHRGRMAVHRLGCDLHHLGLCHNLGYENFRRTMASRYGCEDGESDGRVIVPRTVTVYFGPPEICWEHPAFTMHKASRTTMARSCASPVLPYKFEDLIFQMLHVWSGAHQQVIWQSLNTHGYSVLLVDSRTQSQATAMRNFLCAH